MLLFLSELMWLGSSLSLILTHSLSLSLTHTYTRHYTYTHMGKKGVRKRGQAEKESDGQLMTANGMMLC